MHQGLLTEKEIDVTLKRLFTARFRLGFFDPPEMVPYAQTPASEIDSAAHRALALRAANESIVLLKNDGTLPFQSNVRKVAVFGPLGAIGSCAAWQLQRNCLSRGHCPGRHHETIRARQSIFHSGHEFFARAGNYSHKLRFLPKMGSRGSRRNILPARKQRARPR